MTPKQGLNKAQQEAFLASVKAFQNRTRPKGPAPSGGSSVKPKGGGAMGGMGPRPIGGGPLGPRNPNGPRKPMGSPSPISGGIMAGINSMVNKGLSQQSAAQQNLGTQAYNDYTKAMPRKKGGMATKKMAMGGTVKARPSKMTLPPGEISGGPYRVPPKVSGGPTRLPPGMKPPSGGGDFGSALPGYRPGMKIKDGGGRGVPLPPGMKHGGMAHGKAPKGRGMAIMIAIGKPKGRGKS